MIKTIALVIILTLLAPSIITAGNALAQSTLSIQKFTLRYVDNSYDVPAATSTSTDPYTGKTTTTTNPGYHVENKTVEAVITNIGASYYNFAYKGHFENQWKYYPSNPQSQSSLLSAYNHYDAYSVPCQASNSATTVTALTFLPSLQEGQIDIKVQGLYGSYRAEPYGHAFVLPGGPTYDFYFEGTAGDWSTPQTITIGDDTVLPSPAVPEFPVLAILPLFVVVPLLATVLLRKKRTQT